MTATTMAGAFRRGYLDWLRGVGVIAMIQGHVMDSWTLSEDKSQTAYHWILFVGGVAGAPLFLFLAGVATVLAAGSRLRQGETLREAAALARRRGWQIFGLAFLFRMQSWVISGGPPITLLKVDILNVLGLGMVMAAILWGLGCGPRTRFVVFAIAAASCALATPLVNAWTAISVLPDPIEWYLRPPAATTAFTLLPWAGFLFAGAACGVILEASRSDEQEYRLQQKLAATGVLVAAAGYGASFLPPVYPDTHFWTTSPTFFFLRLGIVTALVPFAYVLCNRWNWVNMREFGRASLFVYWIHVEMVYGVLSVALHDRLSLGLAYAAFIAFTALMFACAKLRRPVFDAFTPSIIRAGARFKLPAPQGAYFRRSYRQGQS